MPCNAIPWRSMRYLKLITLFLISSNSPWFNNHSSSVRTFTPERCANRYTVYVRFFFSRDICHAFQVCVHLEEKQEKGSKNQANIHFRTLVTRTSFMWLQSENSFHTQAHRHTITHKQTFSQQAPTVDLTVLTRRMGCIHLILNYGNLNEQDDVFARNVNVA